VSVRECTAVERSIHGHLLYAKVKGRVDEDVQEDEWWGVWRLGDNMGGRGRVEAE
jgi:hypothetical protein